MEGIAIRVHDHIHLVGSGDDGFGLSDRSDCHVWLINGGSSSVLIDSGGGRDPDRILQLVDDCGLDRDSIDTVVLTHAHADHAGGAAGLREALGAEIMTSAEVARILAAGDAEAASVPAGQSSGAYPPDYQYRACPVSRQLHDGDRLQLGEIEVEVIASPGHATGHLCFLVHAGDRRDLFSGDMMLSGGRLIIQNTWDCESVPYLDSVRRLGELAIDGFFPGHFSFSVERGQRHIEIANTALDVGKFPPVL